MTLELEYEFDPEKNIWLKEKPGVSFEEIIYYINNGHLLDVIKHPNKEKYANQYFYVLDIDDYVYLAPFVRQENKIFLKTLFPSRKHTKKYLAQMIKQRGAVYE